MPQFVTDRLGLGHGWVYAAFLVVSIVSGALLLPFGRIADSRGRRPVIMVGLLIGAVGFVLLPSVPTVVGLLVAMALLGVAGAADSVAPGALMGDVVGGRGGTVVAVFQMSGDLGAVIGPIAAGWIADWLRLRGHVPGQCRGLGRPGAAGGRGPGDARRGAGPAGRAARAGADTVVRGELTDSGICR